MGDGGVGVEEEGGGVEGGKTVEAGAEVERIGVEVGARAEVGAGGGNV